MSFRKGFWWFACAALLAVLVAPLGWTQWGARNSSSTSVQQSTGGETRGPLAVVKDGHPAVEWKGPGGLAFFVVYVGTGQEPGFDFHVWHFHGAHETPGHLYVTATRVTWKPDPAVKYQDAPFDVLRSVVAAPTRTNGQLRVNGQNYSFEDAFEDSNGRIASLSSVYGYNTYCKEIGLQGKECRRFQNEFASWDPHIFPSLLMSVFSDFDTHVQQFMEATQGVSIALPPPQAATITTKEAAGDSAAQAGKLYDALQDYMAAFQAVPTHWAENIEQPLREKIIKLVVRMNPAPAIPPDAMRHEAYAATAFQESTGAQDLTRAARELVQALKLAPWWGEAYKNLGLVLQKTGQFGEAARNLQLYLLAAPNAPDAQNVQTEIYSLQYQAQHPPYLGILMNNVSGDLVKRLGLPDANGAVVMQVVQGGPAAQAGIKEGDVIRTFNSQAVASVPALKQMTITTRAGTTVTLGIVRDGKPMALPVQVAARP
ncbi:MAG TPA: PDZ domain-containing protein [Terriglobia bacterium]|nr:PDZ domain-containing protein [Terriglobia bacterium]